MIELQNVSKVFYSDGNNNIVAIDRLNFVIQEGNFLVVVGSNGSGKSTLLNLISGSIKPDNGKLVVSGIDVTNLPDFKRSNYVSRVFQNPLAGTSPDLTVLENFRIAALRTQSKGLKIGTNNLFRKNMEDKISLLQMNLENKLDVKMGSLSGGQRQALTLVMAITDKSKILLLDEPTAALDPKSSETLMLNAEKIISQFKLTAVLVTHNLKEAFLYGNRIIQMQEGKIARDMNAVEKSSLTQKNLFEWFIPIDNM